MAPRQSRQIAARERSRNTAVKPNFRIAIDFGTTYATIAICTADGVVHVFTIDQFPDDPGVGTNGTQVPTVIWYPFDGSGAGRNLQGVLYGYQALQLLEKPTRTELHNKFLPSELITRPKLMLDDGAHVKDMKKDLVAQLKRLRDKGIVKRNEQVIEDLLICFLTHTKSVLERDHRLSEKNTVEVTLAVPVCWSARSNAVMLECLKKAISKVQLGTDDVLQPRPFMVNEAEAAAMHVVADGKTPLHTGESFILLDCGGGTTDVGTYKVARDRPLRLSEEVVHPRGAVCGSSDLNIRLREQAIRDLQEKDAFEGPNTGASISNIVDSEIMPKFENIMKKSFDPTKTQDYSFWIRGLRASRSNPRLKHNYYVLTREDMLDIFMESFNIIEALVAKQIELSHAKGIEVLYLILAGGFCDSPALKQHLKRVIARINTETQTDIQLLPAPANTSAASVAKGALLRAQNKSNGPKRVLRRSIEMLHHIPEHPVDEYPEEVKNQDLTFRPIMDGYYIWRTIKWIFKVGAGEAQSVHVGEEVTGMHPFHATDAVWEVEEELYASDTCTEDFYQRSHPKNKNKTTLIGKVVLDITYLKPRIMTELMAQDHNGVDTYEVSLRFRLQVIDTDLKLSAYWPADDPNAAPIPASLISFDITAAYPPGT